jgi:hypothetical protein
MYNKKSTNTIITEPAVDSVEGTITNLGNVIIDSWRFGLGGKFTLLLSIIYDIF